METLERVLREVRACAVCAAHLPQGPRPIVQMAASARLLIIGQAPGAKVHASGVAWADDSGDRLRAWMGLDADAFYDPSRVALVPMGFCYPGAANGADLPPRPECAPLWHARLLAQLPPDRLTLLVGMHAQTAYLGSRKGLSMTDAVRAFTSHGPNTLPLPHPSWRSTGWMRRNPWFEAQVLPILRERVRQTLFGAAATSIVM